MFHLIWRFVSGLFTERADTPIPIVDKGPLYKFKMAEGEMPETLKSEVLYVLTEDQVPWEAAMICPCGCGARLELNLLPDERPRWRYSVSNTGVPSLYPSVDRKVGCRSHFFLRHGRIIWAHSYL